MKKIPTEAERLAHVLTIAHGTMKEYFMVRKAGVPLPIMEMFMNQPCGLCNGQLGAIMLELIYLYDKCIKAGLIDQDAVDAAYLVTMRESLAEFKESGIDLPAQSEGMAMAEMHAIVKFVSEDLNRRRAPMPSAEEVIKKAAQ